MTSDSILDSSKCKSESSNCVEKMDCDQSAQLSMFVNVPTPPGPQCYCMSPRDYSRPDFQCSVCYKWFHLECIAFNIGKALPFLTAYHFMCKKCNPIGEEVFSRKQANFTVMCQTALANLMLKHGGRLYFMEMKELIPFLEEYWEELTTQPRKSNNSWHPNIHKTLTSSDVFKTIETPDDLYVCLSNTDLTKIGPSYDRFRALTSQLRTNITKLGVPAANVPSNASQSQSSMPGSISDPVDQSSSITSANNQLSFSSETDGVDVPIWRKRKSPGSGLSGGMGSFYNNSSAISAVPGASSESVAPIAGSGSDISGFPGSRNAALSNGDVSNGLSSGLVRSTRRATSASVLGGTTALSGAASSDEGRAKLNSLGFPIDHALNKEGYRYILVEPDKHASGREQWDECEFTAGKPIPGLFYRVFLCSQVVLSLSDRANHLKVHESQLSVTGEKGYCMARATHSVNSGTWYFEAAITDQPEGSATRIGWSQMYGNLQAPCGYDKFSYSWRSRLGTVFHESRGRHYAEDGYKKDDVVGCMIHLPSTSDPFTSLENQCSESSLLFKTPQTNSLSSVTGDMKSNTDNASGAPSSNKCKSSHIANYLPETYKDRPLIRFRNSFYFEEKDEPTKAEKLLRPLLGSKITFYRNGKCMGTAFTNIYAGTYFPAISIYKSATVSVNFGPYFKYPPTDIGDWEPMSSRVVSAAVEQTVADMICLVEKDGFIERTIKSCTPQ
ncbi:Set1/Ash2 histone methyltransferase complex subunit ASH2 [Schistosoma japonicum]|uniref:Set1/Ash2 histone methyltransferase complex subunit ASH2 n=1 Tax=Schistosoma japonicum TaxID=6182 RepID=A0A4Z2CTP7_SCHJA|nr:Set1/Ash2 histone methyltransferase complex subunit ASH2 [Schistosoma japonicum]TNN07360.1 Set1/Ash2 histone methyltransferase complex subunit ASH2 [Schistosoma japonicum]